MHNMWVAVMDKKGSIRRRDWTPVYTRLRERAGAGFPGYLIHEAARWSSYHRKWFFLPRRVSSEPYDEERDNVSSRVRVNAVQGQQHHVGCLRRLRPH